MARKGLSRLFSQLRNHRWHAICGIMVRDVVFLNEFSGFTAFEHESARTMLEQHRFPAVRSEITRVSGQYRAAAPGPDAGQVVTIQPGVRDGPGSVCSPPGLDTGNDVHGRTNVASAGSARAMTSTVPSRATGRSMLRFRRPRHQKADIQMAISVYDVCLVLAVFCL